MEVFYERKSLQDNEVGAWNIVFGIVMIVVGLTVGIMQIIHGGKLLSDKKEIMF